LVRGPGPGRPPWVGDLGRLAAEAMIPGARKRTLRELVGRTWVTDVGDRAVPVIPLPHPSGVGRWLNDPANRALVDRAVVELARLGHATPRKVGDTTAAD